MKQTIGEHRVGIAFNPSEMGIVDEIKRKAADLIDLIESIESDGILHIDGEKRRAKSLAMTHIEDGAMWGVKAATKPPRANA